MESMMKFKNHKEFANFWMEKGAHGAVGYVEMWCTRATEPAEHEFKKHKEFTGKWYYWHGLITELLTGSRGYIDKLYSPDY